MSLKGTCCRIPAELQMQPVLRDATNNLRCHMPCCCCCCLQLCLLPPRYKDAIMSLKAKVKETEGEDMREAIQDKVRPASLLSASHFESLMPSGCNA
jgi:hypothetical protein